MTRDGRERHRWRVGALARDGVEIETEDDVGVVDEPEAHRGRDVGVGQRILCSYRTLGLHLDLMT